MNARRPRPGLSRRRFLTAPAAWLGAARLAAVVAAAVIGLAACTGSSSSPQVASLGKNASHGSGGGSSTTAQSGNPTQLLDEWAACIRHHGDPSQSDPTIDADKDIEITMNNVPVALANAVHGSTGPCSNYLLAAEDLLRGGQPAPTYNPVTWVKEAECIRAHGVPNYPDPSSDGETDFLGTGVDPDSAAVQNATKLCDQQLGIPFCGSNSPGPPGVVQVTSCDVPPGRQGPPGGPGPCHGGGGPRPAPLPTR